MAAGGTEKRTDIKATKKTRGFIRGWKWQKKADRQRRALEEDNHDGNEEDKGRTESAEKGGREMAELRLRVGSLHCPLSGIRLPLRPICLSLDAEEREVTVLALYEEVEVEGRQRFFRPCRWINRPFTHLRVSAEGALEVAASSLEAEGGCIPRGAVVGVEVGRIRVHRNCHINFVWLSGGNVVI